MPGSIAATLRDRLEQAGGWSFGRFMQAALWDDEGYYAKRVSIGSNGDFYTAASFSLFGATLANYVVGVWSASKAPVLHVVEMGPGEGTLMASLLERLLILLPVDVQICVTLVEPSEALRDRQRARLNSLLSMKLIEPSRVTLTWQPSPTYVGDAVVVIANEVLDALPVERVKRTPQGWLQAFIEVNGAEGYAWRWLPANPDVARYADAWLPIQNGHVAEICMTYAEMLATVAGFGDRVSVLWIDYGMTTEEWASGVRPLGTLRSYRHHELVDVLAFAGEADITADVHWDAVQDEARQAGFSSIRLTSQRQFLLDLDIVGLLQTPTIDRTIESVPASPTLEFRTMDSHAGELVGQLKHLVLPGAMGDRFAVLECVKE